MKNNRKWMMLICGCALFCAAISVTACNTRGNRTAEPAAAGQQIAEDVQNEAAGESDNRAEQSMQGDPVDPVGSSVMYSDLIPSNGRPTLIDFSAEWCGPCRAMKPVFQDLEDTYDDRINFVTVDVDEYGQLAAEYGISSIPTFVFLDKSGKETGRINGAVEQPVLENAINRVISK